jgi:hypothetical protein
MSAPNSFEPFGQNERFGSRPGDIEAPNIAAAVVGMLVLVGALVVICGGLGFYFATGFGRPELAQENPNRQPPVAQPVKAPPQEIEQPTFEPPAADIVPPIPDPPSLPSPPAVDPPVAPRPRPRASSPPPLADSQTDDEKITTLVQQLRTPQPGRPVTVVLMELNRVPVREERREEVAQALDPHLRSKDIGAVNQAVNVAYTWGSATNAEALTQLLDHQFPPVRWSAMQSLAKVAPTPETADKIAAKIGDQSSGTFLRQALQSLGETGEVAILRRLDGGNARVRHEAIILLADIGTEMSRPVLEWLAESDPDFGNRSRAKFALGRLNDRQKAKPEPAAARSGPADKE